MIDLENVDNRHCWIFLQAPWRLLVPQLSLLWSDTALRQRKTTSRTEQIPNWQTPDSSVATRVNIHERLPSTSCFDWPKWQESQERIPQRTKLEIFSTQRSLKCQERDASPQWKWRLALERSTHSRTLNSTLKEPRCWWEIRLEHKHWHHVTMRRTFKGRHNEEYDEKN